MKKNLFVITLLSLVLFCSGIHGQEWSLKLRSSVELRTFKLTNKADVREDKLAGATIALYKGSSMINQIQSDGNGDFVIDVPANGDFILTVMYSGCNTKKFAISTMGVPEEVQKDNYKPTFGIEGVIMAKAFPTIDYSILKQPLVRIGYVSNGKKFDDEELYTNQMLAELSKIRDAENDLIERFTSTNNIGDVALSRGDCPLAKASYEKAMTIIPGESYPGDQLVKVGDCLKNKELVEKKAAAEAAAAKLAAEASAKAKAEAEKAAQEKLAADKLIKEQEVAKKAEEERLAKEKAIAEKASADASAKAKAETDKLSKEQEAAKKAEEERVAKEKIAQEKVQKDKLTAEESLAKAKAAAEKTEADRVDKEKANTEKAEADKLTKEKTSQEKAQKDKLAAEQSAAKAKAVAEKAEAEKIIKEKAAAEKKQADQLAKEKATTPAKTKTDVKTDDDKKKTTSPAETNNNGLTSNNPPGSGSESNAVNTGDAKYSIPQALGADKYKATIKRADELFKMKRYAEAKPMYEEALKQKPNDSYATVRLAEIEQLIKK